MTDPEGFLNKTPSELGGFLLDLARHERAPAAVRERTASRVAALSAVAGMATATKVSLAAGANPAGASWLAAKWFAIGLSTALGTLGVVDQLRRYRWSEPSTPPAAVAPLNAPQPVVQPTAVSAAVASSDPIRAVPQGAVPAAASAAGSSVELELQNPHETSGNVSTPEIQQLSRELGVLKRARSALASGNGTQAELALKQYRAEFAAGMLTAEAAALEVETAFALGERERGMALAAAFLRNHATSPLAARVRAAANAGNEP